MKTVIALRPLIFIIIILMVATISCTDQDSSLNLLVQTAKETNTENVISVGLSESIGPASYFEAFGKAEGDRSFHSNLLFYEVVLSYGPVEDPRPVFLMANAYIISQQQEYGMDFFKRLLLRYGEIMTSQQKSTYLSAYALLRATYADKVPLFKRIGWINDTFDLLEEADMLFTENPLVHWSAGMIYSQVPWFFNKRQSAIKELQWLLDRPELEPTKGFYREAYHMLANLYNQEGNHDQATSYLEISGYGSYQPKVLFSGWFSTTQKEGLTFSPAPWIEEIIEGKVFSLRGFGFSDLNFVVSGDGMELISIDAGTQSYSYKAGYEYLMEHYPELPPLTTVFITHSHWDHIGGYTFLKSVNPSIRIYGRENFHSTLERVQRDHVYEQFRGVDFDNKWIENYKPDQAITTLTSITIGESPIELIPVTGGETEDALLIHFPELKTIFMGDALMPFYGEPWVEEGFIDDAMTTMDEALKRNPKYILHGHVGINLLYGNINQLQVYREAYEWLVHTTRLHIRKGYSAKDIIRMNLIPSGLQQHPQAFFSYLSPRDHVISRVADKMVGIWQEDVTGKEPLGLDVITNVEYGRLLDLYLDLSVDEVEKMLKAMLAKGDNELALQMALAAEKRYKDNAEISQLKEEAGDRLRSAVQFFDPFKFVVYSEIIGKEHEKVTYYK